MLKRKCQIAVKSKREENEAQELTLIFSAIISPGKNKWERGKPIH